MKEYIERDPLMKGVDEFHHTSHIQSITRETEKEKTLWKGIHLGVNYCRNQISEAPIEDVAPIVHGEWIHKNGEMHCSVCGSEALMDEIYYKSPYCPDCGAKMDGGK